MHKSALRTLGVALAAALGLMALFAVAAQAEFLSDGGKAGEFRVEGLGNLVTGTRWTGVQETPHGVLLIEGLAAHLLCGEGEILEAEGKSATEILGKVLFRQCKLVRLPVEEVLTACPIKEEMITVVFRAFAKLHKNASGVNELFVLVEGDGAEQLFSTIEFTGTECSIGTTEGRPVKIKGSVVGRVINPAGDIESLSHLIEFTELIQLLFQVNGVGDKITYGARQAFPDGNGENIHIVGPALMNDNRWSVV